MSRSSRRSPARSAAPQPPWFEIVGIVRDFGMTPTDLGEASYVYRAASPRALAGVVALGMFLSAAGIFSLMSVSVARRTREIGLRTALGESRAGVLRSIVSRAALLGGSGVVAGNVLLLLLTMGEERVPWGFVTRGITSR
jgi:hypothetical protein